jgi:hypothetical protein
MRTFVHHCFAIVATLAVFAGCRGDSARLSQTQVISIAKQAAEAEGRRLADYKEPEAHYEFTEKDKSWSVFFDGKVPMPGNHFLVYVDDQTQKTKLMPGE